MGDRGTATTQICGSESRLGFLQEPAAVKLLMNLEIFTAPLPGERSAKKAIDHPLGPSLNRAVIG